MAALEHHAVGIDRASQGPVRQSDREVLAIEDEAEHLGDLAEQQAALFAHSKPADVVAFKRARNGGPEILEHLHPVRIVRRLRLAEERQEASHFAA